MHRLRTLLDEQRQMIIAEYSEKIGHHELQAAQAEEERRILQEELWRRQKDFREARQQSLSEMEELRKFQSSTFDTLARRKLIEDQSTVLELSGRVQELQNEVNCMNDSKDFQDAESVRSGNSHVTNQPMLFPKHPIPEGMLRPSFVSPRRKEGPPSIWDTHGISGNVFANPHASSSAPYPQELNPWGTTIEEPLHMSTAEKSERQEQSQDLRCQSGPSAKDSVIFSEGDSSKNYGADQQRLQISDLHFDKFPTQATFACWKIRFKTEVCTCSQFPTEAIQWIKEVELVDSVDELKSSSSVRGILMPNFEVLDARIASALNKIIHNSQFKRRISLEEQSTVGRMFPTGNAYSYIVKKDYSYLCMWMTKLAGKKQNLDPMWKVLNKEVDLGEPTSFLDHVYLVCIQRQCEISKDIVDDYRTMLESRISAGATENLPCSENIRLSSWSCDMEGDAKKCVERYCELANKTTQQLYKVSTPCIDDHHFKEEEMKSVGELSHVCSQIVLKCLYLARIGRPDILWSVNKLARSITKWTKACDKRLNRLISYMHHTCEYKRCCHVGNNAKQCRL